MSTSRNIAAAPCSYGVFERTDALADPDWMLDRVAEAGYDGIDLGPPGFLGEGAGLREALARRGLALAGGWVQLTADDPDLTELDAALACFDAGGESGASPAPRPTLAVDGPGRPITGAPQELSEDEWTAMTTTVARAARICWDRGYEPTFHHHVGTWVETPAHVDRLLDEVDVDLCFDTGHLALGGGDPIRDLTRWRDRINHVHLKDVDLGAADRLREHQAPLDDVWREGVFTPLGQGSIDMDQMLEALEGFDGWLVVEQDTVRTDDAGLRRAQDDQRHNRAWLEARGR